MVDEAVDHGGGDDVVAQFLAPAAEGFVGGDDEGGPFVAGGDQLEEQVGGFGFEGDVEPPVSLYLAGPVLADRIGVAVFAGCDS